MENYLISYIPIIIALFLNIVSYLILTKKLSLNLIKSISYDNIFIFSIFTLLLLFSSETTNFINLIMEKATIESFLVITLTFILIDATLSLLDFTYLLTLSDIKSEMENYLNKSEFETIKHSSIAEIKTKMISKTIELSEKTENLMKKFEKLEESLSPLIKENHTIKIEREKLYKKSLEIEEKLELSKKGKLTTAKANSLLKKVERLSKIKKELDDRCKKVKENFKALEDEILKQKNETGMAMKKQIGVTLFEDFYRSKIIKKSGELFFMSTVFFIIGILFLGFYFLIISYSNISESLGLLFKVPLYMLFSYSLGWIILASIIFVKALVNFLRSFNKIGLVEDIEFGKLTEIRSNLINALNDLQNKKVR
jgi:regulator of replication initiation timing